MNAITAFAFACLAATCLTGCNQDEDSGPFVETGPTGVAIPPPEISIELPLADAPLGNPDWPRACRLSATNSCVDLDPRPFEPCLVGSKHCEVEGVEMLPAAPARSSRSPGAEKP